MFTVLIASGFLVSGLIVVIVLGPRPKLDPRAPETRVPDQLSLKEIEQWVQKSEDKVSNLVPGAEAGIQWANPGNEKKTELCFLYLHGFSATRHETAPVTDRIAAEFNANVFHARLEGHGVGSEGMLTESELWLQSAIDSWNVASALGDKVVIVATSTGAALSIWLANQEMTKDKIHAFLFMAPNFKIRNPFGFILTWPWARIWVRALIGKEVSWEPENELAGKYWTSTYSTLSLIEMQKVVDWVMKQDFSQHQIPLATMYMKNDKTIDPRAAIDGHNRWGSSQKQLIPVGIDGDAEQHVFAGNITAPHRVEWCVTEFIQFLKSLE
jgi:esterase/lipase